MILFWLRIFGAIFYDFFVNKQNIKFALKELIIFLVQIAFSRLQFGTIFPAGFAFAMARVFFGGNLFLVSFEYALSNFFVIFEFYSLLNVFFEIVVLTLYYFFKEMFVVKKKRLFLFLFLALSSMLELYFVVSGNIFWREFLIENLAKSLLLLYFLKLYMVYQKKFIFLKCSNLDYLLFSVFVAMFVLGLFRYKLLAESLGLCLFAFAVVFSCRVLPTDKFLIFSLSIALCFGYLLSSVKIVVLSLAVCLLLVSFSKTFKYLFLSVTLLLFYVFLKISNELVISNIVSLVSSVVLLAIIPQKMINKISEFFEEKNVDLIKENLWLEKEKDIKQNLMLMSKTLFKMQADFKFLIVGKIDRKCASSELAGDVMTRCCEDCERKMICQNTLIDKKELLSEYIFYAMNNGGEVSDSELSIGFKTYCNKTARVLKEIKTISKQFLDFEASVKTEDESKLLISTELENFANLFQNFAKNIEKSPKINKNLSNIAKEMLLNNMIEVGDIAVFESKQGIEKIDVVAENNVMMRKELSSELSKIVRSKVQIKKLKHLEFSGLSLVSFVLANSLKLEFAVSMSSKEDISGDNCLISKIDDSRFFVAIADGMGHGKLAGKTSRMVLELIRNLFYVGIDLNIIIESINKLLLPVGLDNFSTLDVAIVDLRLSKCTFIKLGSSVSAIKHKEKTELISSDSLPVGIVQNLSPTIVVKPIQADDIIVLASDGIVDSFADIESYKIFVNDYKISGLQRFVDNVVFELGMQANKHKDDMSIIALKLLKNSPK